MSGLLRRASKFKNLLVICTLQTEIVWSVAKELKRDFEDLSSLLHCVTCFWAGLEVLTEFPWL